MLRADVRGGGRRLILRVPPHLTDLQLGDSINVNGACLTVVEKTGESIAVDVSSETLEKTTFREMRQGEEVNLERAMRLSDRLGGHIVTGHVDAVGTLVERRSEREFVHLKIQVPKSLSKYLVPKGSIAVDGISLTVNACEGDEMGITLIPYTLTKTTLINKRVGDRVNLEADVLGKYVEKLMERRESGKLTQSFLREHGFIEEE
ncbi:MAG: riboflavin synthase subunit alpha [Deltaproteobacteria bacterium RBG_13_52_11b]|nr:MAG: riboflavin synthase subunit alpha [Deltaproteobacteria bacterium RBG_13_52_11b]